MLCGKLRIGFSEPDRSIYYLIPLLNTRTGDWPRSRKIERSACYQEANIPKVQAINMFYILKRLAKTGVVTAYVKTLYTNTKSYTMKLWHWKSNWKSRLRLENLGTKEMSNAENFSVWFKNFLCVISVSLNNKGKYFSEIILNYHCDLHCKYLFNVVSVSFQCHKNFQCHNFIVLVLRNEVPVKSRGQQNTRQNTWYVITFIIAVLIYKADIRAVA